MIMQNAFYIFKYDYLNLQIFDDLGQFYSIAKAYMKRCHVFLIFIDVSNDA